MDQFFIDAIFPFIWDPSVMLSLTFVSKRIREVALEIILNSDIISDQQWNTISQNPKLSIRTAVIYANKIVYQALPNRLRLLLTRIYKVPCLLNPNEEIALREHHLAMIDSYTFYVQKIAPQSIVDWYQYERDHGNRFSIEHWLSMGYHLTAKTIPPLLQRFYDKWHKTYQPSTLQVPLVKEEGYRWNYSMYTYKYASFAEAWSCNNSNRPYSNPSVNEPLATRAGCYRSIMSPMKHSSKQMESLSNGLWCRTIQASRMTVNEYISQITKRYMNVKQQERLIQHVSYGSDRYHDDRWVAWLLMSLPQILTSPQE